MADHSTFTAQLSEGVTTNYLMFLTLGEVAGAILALFGAVLCFVTARDMTKARHTVGMYLFGIVLVGTGVGLWLNVTQPHTNKAASSAQQPGVVVEGGASQRHMYLSEQSITHTASNHSDIRIERNDDDTADSPVTTFNASAERATRFTVVEENTNIVHRECIVRTTAVDREKDTVSFIFICGNDRTATKLTL